MLPSDSPSCECSLFDGEMIGGLAALQESWVDMPPVRTQGPLGKQPRQVLWGTEKLYVNADSSPGAVCNSRCHQPTPRVKVSEKETELVAFSMEEWTKFCMSLTASYFVPAKDAISDVYPALRALGITGKAAIKTLSTGQEYVVISTNNGLRGALQSGAYVASDVKVAKLVIGGTRMMKSAKGGLVITFVLVGAADVMEAILDDKELLTEELGLTLFVDFTKAFLATLASVIVGTLASTIGMPVVISLGATIVVGIAIGMTLDYFYPTDRILIAISKNRKSLLGFYDYLNHSAAEIQQTIVDKFNPMNIVPFHEYDWY